MIVIAQRFMLPSRDARPCLSVRQGFAQASDLDKRGHRVGVYAIVRIHLFMLDDALATVRGQNTQSGLRISPVDSMTHTCSGVAGQKLAMALSVAVGELCVLVPCFSLGLRGPALVPPEGASEGLTQPE